MYFSGVRGVHRLREGKGLVVEVGRIPNECVVFTEETMKTYLYSDSSLSRS